MQRVEQVWVEVPPLIRTVQIADVPAIPIVAFVWKQPPCNAEMESR